MLRKLTFCLLTALLLWPLAQNRSLAQAPAAKPWKDREEYDLFNSIIKETAPARKLQLLDQYKQKYPDTAYKEERSTLYIQAYQQAGQPAKAVEAANELLATMPDNFTALYTIAALTPFIGSTDQKVWEGGATAGAKLLQILDTQFAPDKKPATVSDADWANAKKGAQFVGNQVIGWAAMMQKKNEAAEQGFIKTLDVNPTAAQVSYWLGNVVLAEKNPDKNALALYEFARAAAYDGPGALPPAARNQIDAYLTKTYKAFHGDDPAGLNELKTLAKNPAQPLPPPDLKIKSKDEIDAENAEKAAKENPKLHMFMQIKEGLTGSDSAAFWGQMKGTAMPALHGKVIAAKPAVNPKTIEVAVSQPNTAEITITSPEEATRCKLDGGEDIDFEGAEAKEFTASPFMIKMEGGKITSGCKQAPAPVKKAVKKAAPAKKAE